MHLPGDPETAASLLDSLCVCLRQNEHSSIPPARDHWQRGRLAIVHSAGNRATALQQRVLGSAEECAGGRGIHGRDHCLARENLEAILGYCPANPLDGRSACARRTDSVSGSSSVRLLGGRGACETDVAYSTCRHSCILHV